MRIPVLFIALASLSFAGCTTDINKVARAHHIASLKVEPRVDVERPMSAVFQTDTGDLTVALAGLIVDHMRAKSLEALAREMEKNHIEVPVLVRESATAMLRDAKQFTISTNIADGTFVIAIRQYGFEGAGLTGAKKVPFIVLRAQLFDRAAERVWSGEGQAHPLMSGDVGARREVYEEDAELLRAHWQRQVEVADACDVEIVDYH